MSRVNRETIRVSLSTPMKRWARKLPILQDYRMSDGSNESVYFDGNNLIYEEGHLLLKLSKEVRDKIFMWMDLMNPCVGAVK